MIDITQAVTKLTAASVKTLDAMRHRPVGPEVSVPLTKDEERKIPKTLDELGNAVVRGYNLSVNMASKLNIPVIGSVSGGYSRRVVVMERTAFKKIPHGREKHLYGYAIRLCVTTNKWDSSLKTNLAFLAASAEVGIIKAEWAMHVMGLAGKKIDTVSILPKELSVDTYVNAKESLGELIKAVRDPSTKFIPSLVAIERPKDILEMDCKIAILQSYALSGIEKGWTIKKAIKELNVTHDEMIEAVKKIYSVVGIVEEDAKPNQESRNWAKDLLDRIEIKLKKRS